MHKGIYFHGWGITETDVYNKVCSTRHLGVGGLLLRKIKWFSG